jgi:hypothetical protein
MSGSSDWGRVRVRAASGQVEVLLGWAAGWPTRTWAVEGARGLGRLLAQQLIAAGECVFDVPPKLAARVRLLDIGQINKNDPKDARSVAVAALRAHDLPRLTVEDHTTVMRVWARRYHDSAGCAPSCVVRLHAVLCELVPGGSEGVDCRRRSRSSTASTRNLSRWRNSPLARDLVTDLQRSTPSAARPDGAPRGRSPHRARRSPPSTVSADHRRHRTRPRT